MYIWYLNALHLTYPEKTKEGLTEKKKAEKMLHMEIVKHMGGLDNSLKRFKEMGMFRPLIIPVDLRRPSSVFDTT